MWLQLPPEYLLTGHMDLVAVGPSELLGDGPRAIPGPVGPEALSLTRVASVSAWDVVSARSRAAGCVQGVGGSLPFRSQIVNQLQSRLNQCYGLSMSGQPRGCL